MLSHLVVALLIASNPAEPGPAASMTVAAPGFTAAGVDEKKATFLNDFFAQELSTAANQRVRVITQSEVATLIGHERQRQLLGCSDTDGSCMAELSGALGADALVVGNVGRFGSEYGFAVKVVSARDGKQLAMASRSGLDEEELMHFARTAARDVVRQIYPDMDIAVDTRARNQLWLTLIGAEYARRVSGSFWLGGRGTLWSFGFLEVDIRTHFLAMARYHVLNPDSLLNYGVYAGAGYGVRTILNADDTTTQAGSGVAALAGAEVGLGPVRAALEVVYSGGTVALIPGLSAAIAF